MDFLESRQLRILFGGEGAKRDVESLLMMVRRRSVIAERLKQVQGRQ